MSLCPRVAAVPLPVLMPHRLRSCGAPQGKFDHDEDWAYGSKREAGESFFFLALALFTTPLRSFTSEVPQQDCGRLPKFKTTKNPRAVPNNPKNRGSKGKKKEKMYKTARRKFLKLLASLSLSLLTFKSKVHKLLHGMVLGHVTSEARPLDSMLLLIKPSFSARVFDDTVLSSPDFRK